MKISTTFLMATLAFCVILGCIRPLKVMKNSKCSAKMVEELSKIDLEMLSGTLGTGAMIDSVWAEGKCKRDLVAVAKDSTLAFHPRFSASLILLFREENWRQLVGDQSIAEVFTEALRIEATGWTWHWGKLGFATEDPGPYGMQIVKCGDAAIRYLLPLLSDHTIRDRYFGQEEATEMAMRQYRTCDFAAFYIAEILHYKLIHLQDLNGRDAAINRMRSDLRL